MAFFNFDNTLTTKSDKKLGGKELKYLLGTSQGCSMSFFSDVFKQWYIKIGFQMSKSELFLQQFPNFKMQDVARSRLSYDR